MSTETDFTEFEQQFAIAGTWRLLENLDPPSLADMAMLAPNGADVQLTLSREMVRSGNLDKARIAAANAIHLAPQSPDAHALHAALLIEMGDAAVSIEHLEYVVALLPTWSEAWRMLGEASFRVGDLEEATRCMQRAVELRPDWPEVTFRLGEIMLKQGDYPNGWALYESRWGCEGYTPLDSLSHVPEFTGAEPLEGKRIVVIAEQGLGDLIHYIRYAQVLRKRGAEVVVTCPSDMATLIRRSPGVSMAVPFGMMIPRVDYQVHLLSLPYLLGTMLGSTRASVPYLTPLPDLREKWRQRIDEYAAANLRRVGVVWSGLSTHPYNPGRSVPLPSLQPLFDVAGISWFSLQKGPAAGDLLEYDSPLIDLAPDLHTFEHTAAAIDAMDLVITVDTAVAHLCGALNHDGWLLLHTGSDYRWLTDSDRSPWYPSLHLFRQEEEGAWMKPIERVAQGLTDWVKGQ